MNSFAYFPIRHTVSDRRSKSLYCRLICQQQQPIRYPLIKQVKYTNRLTNLRRKLFSVGQTHVLKQMIQNQQSNIKQHQQQDDISQTILKNNTSQTTQKDENKNPKKLNFVYTKNHYLNKIKDKEHKVSIRQKLTSISYLKSNKEKLHDMFNKQTSKQKTESKKHLNAFTYNIIR